MAQTIYDLDGFADSNPAEDMDFLLELYVDLSVTG
jgi:hypothetical protein